jgi:hypothetical protein
MLLSPYVSCVEYMIVNAEVATHEKRNDEKILFCIYKNTVIYQSNTTKLYYVYYIIIYYLIINIIKFCRV